MRSYFDVNEKKVFRAIRRRGIWTNRVGGRLIACKQCESTGFISPDNTLIDCHKCNGSGRIVRSWGTTLCGNCLGKGSEIYRTKECEECLGTGYLSE